jgi:hypothetical protein
MKRVTSEKNVWDLEYYEAPKEIEKLANTLIKTVAADILEDVMDGMDTYIYFPEPAGKLPEDPLTLRLQLSGPLKNNPRYEFNLREAAVWMLEREVDADDKKRAKEISDALKKLAADIETIALGYV